MPGQRVGPSRQQRLDHGGFLFENRAGERRLAPVVKPVNVGTVLGKRRHDIGVTVVGGKHEQCIAPHDW